MQFILSAICICWLFAPAALAATPGPTVHWYKQRLTVESAGAPVVRILTEIARQSGLRVEGGDSLRQPVDAHFVNLPLGEALSQLLPGVNFALVERPWGGSNFCTTLIILGERLRQTARHDRAPAGSTQETGSSSEADERLQEVYEAAQIRDFALLQQAASTDNADATRAVALDLLSQKDPDAAARLALTDSASSDLGRRIMGLQALGRADSAAAVKALRDALGDSDEGVRETALTALAQQSSAVAAHLISIAADDPDPSIQTFAENLLRTMRGAGEAASRDAPSE